MNAVQEFVECEFAKIGTKNTLTFETVDAAEAWVTENYKTCWNYQAAIRATEVGRLFLCPGLRVAAETTRYRRYTGVPRT